jgi:hypothetical protein
VEGHGEGEGDHDDPLVTVSVRLTIYVARGQHAPAACPKGGQALPSVQSRAGRPSWNVKSSGPPGEEELVPGVGEQHGRYRVRGEGSAERGGEGVSQDVRATGGTARNTMSRTSGGAAVGWLVLGTTAPMARPSGPRDRGSGRR